MPPVQVKAWMAGTSPAMTVVGWMWGVCSPTSIKFTTSPLPLWERASRLVSASELDAKGEGVSPVQPPHPSPLGSASLRQAAKPSPTRGEGMPVIAAVAQ
jgi:hypothetical protein